MKNTYLLAGCLLLARLVFGQSHTKLIQPQTPQAIQPGMSAAQLSGLHEYTYVDGIGRVIQKNQSGFSKSGKDLIQPIVYELSGQATKNYLPYTKNSGGIFNPDALNDQALFYQSTPQVSSSTHPFAISIFDNSPLRTLAEKGEPGTDFQPGEHSMQFLERPNKLEDQILIMELNPLTGIPEVKKQGYNQVQALNFDDPGQGNITYQPSSNLVNCTQTPGVLVSPNSGSNTKWAFGFNRNSVSGKIQIQLPAGRFRLVLDYLLPFGGSPIPYIRNTGTNQIIASTWSTGNTWKELLVDIPISTGIQNLEISCSGPSSLLLVDNIRILDLNQPSNLPAYYPAGSLWIQEQTDENGHRSLEAFDQQGLKIFTRRFGVTDPIETYSIYTNRGLLASILQPEAVRQLIQTGYQVNSQAPGAANGKTLYELYSFRYQYDYLNRLIRKTEPGNLLTEFVYDKLNRPVMSQDNALRKEGKWLVQKYDVLGREIMKLIFVTEKGMTRQQLQDIMDMQSEVAEKSIGTNLFYSLNVFPQSSFSDTLTINYYDSYDASRDGLKEWNHLKATFIKQPSIEIPLGQLTVVKQKSLGQQAGAWTSTVIGYDPELRNNVNYQTNPEGGIHVENTQLDFNGRVIMIQYQHSYRGAIPTLEWTLKKEYDPAGREKFTLITPPGMTEMLMRQLDYNELGQVSKKSIHSYFPGHPFLQTLDYTYHIRGWLKSINNPHNLGKYKLFAMSLNYNEGFLHSNTGGVFGATKQYNGNISAMQWSSKRDEVLRGFTFSYDEFDRITRADFFGRSKNGLKHENGRYQTEGISYDLNGNILSMHHHGQIVSQRTNNPSDYGWIDHLNYTYSGNQLESVSDGVALPASGLNDFPDRAKNGKDYEYDENMRLKTDKNQEIQLISYNVLGLVQTIEWKNGDYLINNYDAGGTKWRSRFYHQGKCLEDLEYYGPAVYRNGMLDIIHHEEGRLVAEKQVSNGIVTGLTGKYLYHYDYRDHLGNTRMTYTPALDPNGNWKCTYEEGDYDSGEGEGDTNFDPNDDEPVFGGKSAPIKTNEMAHEGIYSGKMDKPFGTHIRFDVQMSDTVRAKAYAFVKENKKSDIPGNPGWLLQLLSLHPGVKQVGPDGTSGNSKPIIGINTVPLLLEAGKVMQGIPNVERMKGHLVIRTLDSNGNVVGLQSVGVNTEGVWTELENELVINNPLAKEAEIFVGASEGNLVYFDDIAVERKRMLANILQENHYYPYGLNIKGLEYTDAGPDTNHYALMTGKELVMRNHLEYYDFGARMYDPRIGRWISPDPLANRREWLSTYNYCQDNPINRIDPTGELDDDYFIRNNGSIVVKKTDDKFDRFFIETNQKITKNLLIRTYSLAIQLEKNDAGLLALPASFKGEGFGFTYTGSPNENYISGPAFAGLLGALKEAQFSDISLNHWSNSDGSSPKPSRSHKNGEVGDIRPLRLDHSGEPVLTTNSEFDANRNEKLIRALKKFGWRSILSEKNSFTGYITPGTTHYSGYRSRKSGNWINVRHNNHFHIQKFKPNLKPFTPFHQ
ncbi:MAG: RHS repeat-associated core domain-containing protein [Bacteroidetes bacterium]|nr:RHS repeat-associated core domain-containing protein [Bacteroidota bacterium]